MSIKCAASFYLFRSNFVPWTCVKPFELTHHIHIKPISTRLQKVLHSQKLFHSYFYFCGHSQDSTYLYFLGGRKNYKMSSQSTGAANTSWTSSINPKGAFVRRESAFRNCVTADGSSGFKAEANRYHIYVSLACPWAHRVLIVRKLKGLEDVLPYTVVDWFLGENGWSFTDQKPQCSLDTVNNAQYIKEIYFKADPNYDRNYTVPVLWDKQKQTIVNNESSEIIRMLNTEFNAFCKTDAQRKLNLYPDNLKTDIDDVNSFVYPNINNGVYRSGFARSQEAYDEAVLGLFEALEKVEEMLSKKRYLCGSQLTEADVRLFTTLIRFDWVYHQHFKCNKKRLVDYPSIWAFTRDIYQIPGVAETVDKEHIRKHYMVSHESINPFGIVPIGPDLNLDEAHERENMQ